MHEGLENVTYRQTVSIPDPVHSPSWILGMGSWMECCHWINDNHQIIFNFLFIDVAHFTHDEVNSTRNSDLWDHDNTHELKSNSDHLFAIDTQHHWWPYNYTPHLPRTCCRWYSWRLLATWTATHLKECSSVNTMSDVLLAWQSTPSFQLCHHTVPESEIPNWWNIFGSLDLNLLD